jgi:uncharacterized membrane protein
MVECHVFNALLAPSFRDTGWFGVLNWLNGLVAPAFLLVSGAVMGLNLQNRWGRGNGKMWRRIGQIFIVAYLLHLPTPFLWQFFGVRGPRLVELWTKQDILQCVAGSLAVILLLAPVTRRPSVHGWVCAALGVLAGTCTVAVDTWARNGVAVPGWLLNYVWPTGVGRFPLVPWAAFPLIGVWLGPAIFAEKSVARQSGRALAAGIVLLIAAQFMASRLAYDAPFVFGRVGWTLVGLAVCCWWREPVRGTEWILQFGQLSLWSYTVHLVIVYGSCMSLGLDALKPRFGPVSTTACLAAVLFVTALVVGWRAKNLQRQKSARIMAGQ